MPYIIRYNLLRPPLSVNGWTPRELIPLPPSPKTPVEPNSQLLPHNETFHLLS
uniref:Uncharacterized protein n=1 Tax=Lepeophtheirus salmonis TaxID=72036 RepID=A0A0K2USV7_LEPSM